MVHNYKFKPSIAEPEAWAIVKGILPSAQRAAAALNYFPFFGFIHEFDSRVLRDRGRLTVHTLVDQYNGSAYISDSWPELLLLDSESDLVDSDEFAHIELNIDTARRSALRAINAMAIKRFKLAAGCSLQELQCFDAIWKPCWLLACVVAGDSLEVVVDGMSGGYYVLGT